ncbi:D-alanine--D-alanine ligase family protein [Thermosipho atlanticus]|uniref:D-alanine-D-alanine ligase n=1 Tax=Thermosipho atlanticus DSM 15807 TaxID=1123380 RepID=A0A1M5S3D4_9BACT|nr:ATP-grasp domain-containing protein [Thermosipho atlanticus]SHH33117.1 D-alanine-D-alanine ligase [Thermosipho atlanticus DSM 15807]
MKIAIVHEINLNEEEKKMVESVKKALSKKYECELVPFDETFISRIKDYNFVFNLSNKGGKETKQLHVPAILDALNIPYTASNAYSHSLCLDKITTKIIMKYHNIPTPEFMYFDIGELPEKIDDKIYIVKPPREGSAKGITRESVVDNLEDMRKQIKKIHEEFKQPALVEEFIDGMEVSVGLIGNDEDLEVLPILEIDFSSLPEGLERFYSYNVKHNYGEQTNYVCPARIPEQIKNSLEKYAKKLFKVLSLKDYARMDVRIRNGNIYFIEVNSLPQLVPVYSDITKMAEAAGITYEDLIMKILESAMRRYKGEEK